MDSSLISTKKLADGASHRSNRPKNDGHGLNQQAPEERGGEFHQKLRYEVDLKLKQATV